MQSRAQIKGASLVDGVVIDGTVQCLWHGSQFQTAQGAVKCGPALAPIRTYQVSETPSPLEP